MSLPYFVRLGERLQLGLKTLPASFRDRHARFLVSRQTEEGGFTGRDVDLNGDPIFEDGTQADLYYTSFAIRTLAGLGQLGGEHGGKIAAFLKSPSGQPRSVVDLVSWLSSAFMLQIATGQDLFEGAPSDWGLHLAQQLEACRASDGGYAKTVSGTSGSTYHSFLVMNCYELIGQPLPAPERLIDFLHRRQREDGGFVEIGPMRRSGTNPTAAAVATLSALDALDSHIANRVAEFLCDVCADDGGFQANTQIPFSDLLSTFTGVLTLLEINHPEAIALAKLQRTLQELEFPDGGFRAAIWDQTPDVEYTFYGVGTMGLLQELGA